MVHGGMSLAHGPVRDQIPTGGQRVIGAAGCGSTWIQVYVDSQFCWFVGRNVGPQSEDALRLDRFDNCNIGGEPVKGI